MRAAKLAVVDAAAKCQRVVQHRTDIENTRVAPAIEHPFKFRIQFCSAGLFRMQKRGREDVDVTVREASRYGEILAIDLRRARGNADRSNRSDSLYLSV